MASVAHPTGATREWCGALVAAVLAPLAAGCFDSAPGIDAGPPGDSGLDASTARDGAIDGSADADAATCSYPPGPHGTSVGRSFAPFELEDCDGATHAFYGSGYCEASLTLIHIVAGWCSACIVATETLEARITTPYRPRGVRVFQVLVQDEDYELPSAADCSEWVTRFGLTSAVLLDPSALTSRYFPGGTLPLTLIVDDAGIIRFRQEGNMETWATTRAALDGLLP